MHVDTTDSWIIESLFSADNKSVLSVHLRCAYAKRAINGKMVNIACDTVYDMLYGIDARGIVIRTGGMPQFDTNVITEALRACCVREGRHVI
jgi:hypothetical protein